MSSARTYSTPTPGLGAVRYWGNDWRIVHLPTGSALPSPSSARNSFPTLREARAAAGRLGDVLPFDWTLPEPNPEPVPYDSEEARELRGLWVDAMTGTTEEERDEAVRTERERREDERKGGWARKGAESRAAELGHELDWLEYGQRSWIGRCACGAEVRVAYCSMKRTHDRGYGSAVKKSCDGKTRRYVR